MTIQPLRSIACAAFVAALCACPLAAGDIKVDGKFISTESKEPPMEVKSKAKVDNLNADMLDGLSGTDFYTTTQLSSSGGATVHFDNITDIPSAGGPREINQDCATAGGCFAGDSAGFPVTITEAGSYRLTSNLDVTVEATPEDVTAIQVVDVSGVTIDLDGFAILGPTRCRDLGVSQPCAPTGSGDGIRGTCSSTPCDFPENFTVFNGTVRGMGRAGIDCSHCTVHSVHVRENGNAGIDVFRGLVYEIVANYNHRGIDLETGTVRDSEISQNLGAGISVFSYSSIIGNRVVRNGSSGIWCPGGDCLVLDNILVANDGAGLVGGTFSDETVAYGRNMIRLNAGGAVDGFAVQVDTNVCGSSTCP